MTATNMCSNFSDKWDSPPEFGKPSTSLTLIDSIVVYWVKGILQYARYKIIIVHSQVSMAAKLYSVSEGLSHNEYQN